MANRPKAGEYRTKYSWANTYIAKRKKGEFSKIRTSYPFDYNRRAANIDYEADSNHRMYGGKAPLIANDPYEKRLSGAKTLNDQEFQYVAEGSNKRNIPVNFIGTYSGIEELINPPGTVDAQQGDSTNKPFKVTGSGGVFTEEALFVTASYPTKTKEANEAYESSFVNDGSRIDTRLNWRTKSSYTTPTYPNVRFPDGAAKLRRKK